MKLTRRTFLSLTPFTSGGKSLVAMVHGRNATAMVRRAVELIGGIEPDWALRDLGRWSRWLTT